MDILKKFIILAISLGILTALFTVGMVFFAAAIILFPIIYFYQRYKMGNLGINPTEQSKPANRMNEDLSVKTIDAEFEVIEEEKK